MIRVRSGRSAVSVAHHTGGVVVAGSNPAVPTIFSVVAQRVTASHPTFLNATLHNCTRVRWNFCGRFYAGYYPIGIVPSSIAGANFVLERFPCQGGHMNVSNFARLRTLFPLPLSDVRQSALFGVVAMALTLSACGSDTAQESLIEALADVDGLEVEIDDDTVCLFG